MTRRLIRLALLAPILAAGGCVQLPTFPDPEFISREVDPTSPAAQRVLRAEQEATLAAYPTFADIPVLPADARPPAAWNAAAGEVLGLRDGLNGWAQANPAELTDTEAFARGTRDSLGLDPSTLPPAPTPEESAAYARAQRERATPRD